MDLIGKIIEQKYGNVTYGDVYWKLATVSGAALVATVDYGKNSSVVAIRVHTLVLSQAALVAADMVISDPRTTTDLFTVKGSNATEIFLAFQFPYIFHGDTMSLKCSTNSCAFSVGYQPIFLNKETK
jgi:hypothetical protein